MTQAPEGKENEAFLNLRKGMEEYFEDFEVEMPEQFEERGSIYSAGWTIRYVVSQDETGAPTLDFLAEHRMTNLAHVRILPNGEVISVGVIMDHYGYDPNRDVSEEAAKRRLEEHNERVFQGLREKGLV